MPTPWFTTRIAELEAALRESEVALSNALARVAELEVALAKASYDAHRVVLIPPSLNPGPNVDASPWLKP